MASILDMDLKPEDEKMLRETLETWKEEMAQHLEEENERKIQEKLEELEVAAAEYKEELKEEFADKLVVALDEMRDELRSEIIAEMVKSNPEIQILEKIKELVAPTLNEEYFQNVYADELISLKEQNDQLKEKIALDEGAKTLAELVAPYSRKTQNIIISLIKPGDAEAVTEQFYDIIENLEAINEEDKDEDETMEDEGDEEDKAEDKEEDKKPKKSDFEDEEEYKKALEKWTKDHEKKETKKDEKEEDDEDEEEDVTTESVVDKGILGLNEENKSKANSVRDRIMGLTK